VIIKDALAVIKPHLPIFQSELLMQAWQTLEDYCTQPTAHNSQSMPSSICHGCGLPIDNWYCDSCRESLST
jgi:hypothetical protein